MAAKKPNCGCMYTKNKNTTIINIHNKTHIKVKHTHYTREQVYKITKKAPQNHKQKQTYKKQKTAKFKTEPASEKLRKQNTTDKKTNICD